MMLGLLDGMPLHNLLSFGYTTAHDIEAPERALQA